MEKIISDNGLSKDCRSAIIGRLFVGINVYIQALKNRNYPKKDFIEYLHNKYVRHCLIEILKMNKHDLSVAQISNKQKIASLLYLAGKYDLAQKYI